MFFVRLLYLSLLILFLNTNLDAFERKLKLNEAIEIALKGNHEIRAFKNALLSAKEDLSISKSHLFPKLIFEERFMRTNNPTYSFMAKLNQSRFSESDFHVPSLNNPKATNDFQSSIYFEQPVFVKKIYVGIDMSKTELDSKRSSINRKKEEIILKILHAFSALSISKEYVSASQKSIDEAKEHLRIAELRYKNNLGLTSDVLRAQTALKEAEQNHLKSLKNLNVSKRALGVLLGLNESVDILDDHLPLRLHPYDYYDKQSINRADISALKLKVENAKKNITLSETDYYPIIGVGGGYQLNDHRMPFGSEGTSWQVTAFLRWNIFDGTKREHERAKAKYLAQETMEHFEAMKKAVSYKVFEAYQDYESAKKAYEIALSALESAEEGMRLVRVRYENALSPLVDLLSAQSSLDNARANLTARKNDMNISMANLAYESGILLKEFNMQQMEE
ncbi:MAG TPA: TolC family protein [Nitrospirae bacterium]|nr:TolC family protein [Nitrospirota bacterium]